MHIRKAYCMVLAQDMVRALDKVLGKVLAVRKVVVEAATVGK